MVKKIIFLMTLIALLALALVFASQSSYHSDLGNITSDREAYSCFPSCIAYVNLTVNSTGPYANDNLTVSLNNTAEDSRIEFMIEWYDGSDWVNQSNNHTFINDSNLNLTASSPHQFRINITPVSALTTKWNVSFNVNGTDYVLDPYIDSINLTHPENYNITNDQTPEFNFTLHSDSYTLQSCSLYLNISGTWTGYGTNSSVLNGSNAGISSSSTLSEGNYTWRITCNESGNSGERWVYVDDTNDPSVTSVYSSPSSTSVLITWNTDESANSSVSYGTSYSLGSLEDSPDRTSGHSIEILDLSPSTTYYYNVTSCDAQGNCATSGTHTFATSAYSSNTGTSGGSVTASTKKTKTWSLITEGSTKTWTLNDANSGLKEINITVNNESNSVKLTVSKYASKPSPVSAKAGEVYKYISIITENLQYLERASLQFQVEKEWMQNNSLPKEDMSLFRFSNSTNIWEEIHTTFDSEDSTYYYYRSGITSFSYFVMAGPDPPVQATVNDTETTISSEDTNATTEDAQENAESGEQEKNWTGVIILVVIIAIVAIGVVILIVYTQLFKKKQK
jgi:PGF-pre-PGF domain-containing protein